MAEEEKGEGGAKKGGLVKTLLIAGVALAGGAALGIYVLGPTLAPRLVQAGTTAPVEEAGNHEGDAHGGAVTDGDGPAGPDNLFTLDNFIVNPAGTDGTRFLMMSLAIQVADAKTVETLGLRDAEIRDALIRAVGSKTVRELADVSLREELVADVKSALDGVLGDGVVRRIFIPQFVIQ